MSSLPQQESRISPFVRCRSWELADYAEGLTSYPGIREQNWHSRAMLQSITSLAGIEREVTKNRGSITHRIPTEVSSRPEESHLRALPEPCMNLSIHTAPDVRPLPWHKTQ